MVTSSLGRYETPLNKIFFWETNHNAALQKNVLLSSTVNEVSRFHRATHSRRLTFVILLRFSSVTILMKLNGSNFHVVRYYDVQGD